MVFEQNYFFPKLSSFFFFFFFLSYLACNLVFRLNSTKCCFTSLEIQMSWLDQVLSSVLAYLKTLRYSRKKPCPSPLVWYCACFSMNCFLPWTFIFYTIKTYCFGAEYPTFPICSEADPASSKLITFRIVKNIPGRIKCQYTLSHLREAEILWFVFLLANAGNRKGKQPALLEAVLCLLQNQAKLPVWYFPGSSGRWNHVEIKRSLKV